MKQGLLLIACLWAFSSWAQDRPFYGRVTDKDTKEGIPFCLVKVKDRYEGVYTDENGRFAFTANPDSSRILIFYCLGYNKLELQASQLKTDSNFIHLTREYSSLKEVVIKDRTGKQKHDYIGKKMQCF